MTASPYTLYASDYHLYASETNGAYLHSIQGGDVVTGFGGNWTYGCYSSPAQSDLDYSQLYILQGHASGTFTPPSTCGNGSAAAPTTAADYFFVVVKAPDSNNGASSIPPFDISQSSTLLIQMGNTFSSANTGAAIGGNATTLTVQMNDDPVAGNSNNASDVCSVDQPLKGVGTTVSYTGALVYSIPIASFTCTKGSLSALQANGVTAIAVLYIGDRNPNVVANELDTIGVGYIGFTK